MNLRQVTLDELRGGHSESNWGGHSESNQGRSL